MSSFLENRKESPRRPQAMSQIGKFIMDELLGSSKFFKVFRATVLEKDPAKDFKNLLHSSSSSSQSTSSSPPSPEPTGLVVGEKVIIKYIEPDKRSARTSDLLMNELSLCKTLSQKSDHFIAPVEVMRDTVSNQLIALIWRDVGATSLKNLIHQNGPFSFPLFLHVSRQIAFTLHLMHCEGIIHKDIKSANIVINPQTLHVFIIDLNSASYFREISSSSSPTPNKSHGTPMGGTVEYMSPEQTGKVDHPVDCRSDIYSTGMTFFELLIGFTPFHHLKSRSAIVYGHVAINVPPLNHLKTLSESLKIPPVICSILHKMIQKNPEERYQSAYGVWKDLEQAHEFLLSSNIIPSSLIKSTSFIQQIPEEMYVLDLQLASQNRSNLVDQKLPFELGQFDHSPFLKQSSQLYCRDAELNQIISDFGETLGTKRSRLISVYGFSGIGKTRLITESVRQIKRSLDSQTLVFASGKFEQFNSSTPFVGFKALFESLLLQFSLIFDVTFLKMSLIKSLDPDTLALLLENELVPGLSKLLGETVIDKSHEIRPLELQLRIEQSVCSLLTAFSEILANPPVFFDESEEISCTSSSSSSIPSSSVEFAPVLGSKTKFPTSMILFLDDLQWAGSSSLKLLRKIVASKKLTIFFFASIRHNESSSELDQMIEGLCDLNRARKIHLGPLTSESINFMISNMLDTEPSRTSRLSKIIEQKTDGNPFFIKEFIMRLIDQNVLSFSFEDQRWQLDWDKIESFNINLGSLLDMLITKIQELDPKTLNLLSVGSCIGNSFSLANLKTFSGLDDLEIMSLLHPTLRAGIIQQTDVTPMTKKVRSSSLPKPDPSPITAAQMRRRKSLARDKVEEEEKGFAESDIFHSRIFVFNFVHDRIHECLYNHMPADQRASLHHRIGTLLKNNQTDNQKQTLFEVARHLNIGFPLITSIEGLSELIRINQTAGMEAFHSAAFTQSESFAESALKALNEIHSKIDPSFEYPEMFDLQMLLAESKHLLQKFDEAEKELDKAKVIAGSNKVNVIKVLRMKIALANSLGHYAKSIEIGYEAFEILEAPLPAEVTFDMVEEKRKHVFKIIEDNGNSLERAVEAVMDKAEQSWESEAIQNITLDITPAAFLVGKFMLYGLLSFRAVKCSLENGIIESSCIGFSTSAVILQCLYPPSKSIPEFANVSEKLAFESGISFNIGRALTNCGTVSMFCGTKERSKQIYDAAIINTMKVNDINYWSYSIVLSSWAYFTGGMNLQKLDTYTVNLLRASKKYKLEPEIGLVGVYVAIQNLTRFGDLKNLPKISNFTSDISEADFSGVSPVFQSSYWVFLMATHLIFNEIDAAFEIYQKVFGFLKMLTGMLTYFEFLFFGSLVLSAKVYRSKTDSNHPLSVETQNEFIEQIKTFLKDLKVCTVVCPENFESKALLVEAELLKIQGDFKAIIMFDKAISSALTNGFWNVAAVAAEKCFEFFNDNDAPVGASLFFEKAFDYYRNWGARSKIRKMKKNVIKLIKKKPSPDDQKNRASSSDHLVEAMLRDLSDKSDPSSESESIEGSTGDGDDSSSHQSRTATPRGSSDTPSRRGSSVGIPEKLSSLVSDDDDENEIIGNDKEFVTSNSASGSESEPVDRSKSDKSQKRSRKSETTSAKGIDNKILKNITTLLTSEGNMYNIIKVLSEIIMEHACAHKGIMLLSNESQLFIIARWENQKILLHHIPDTDAPRPEEGIGPMLLARNCAQEFSFEMVKKVLVRQVPLDLSECESLHDQYLDSHKPKNVLCLPMINSGKTMGVLYLENNLINLAFPQKKRTLLNHLASQISLSIHRAKLNIKLEKSLNELKEVNKDLVRLNKTKDDFLANTSHELRTPLNAVSGFCDLLLETNLDTEQKEFVELIGTSTRGLISVISDLLDFRSCQQNTLRIVNSPFNIRELIDEIAKISSIKKSTITFHLDLEMIIRHGFILEGDANRLQQVLLNLLANSIKFTSQGHVVLSISINTDPKAFAQCKPLPVKIPSSRSLSSSGTPSAAPPLLATRSTSVSHSVQVTSLEGQSSQDQSSLEVPVGSPRPTRSKNDIRAFSNAEGQQPSSLRRSDSVEKKLIVLEFKIIDTGIGMEEDVQKHIFEPFYQADSSSTRVFEGTGLGLSISLSLVRSMSNPSNFISTQSVMGKGSVFSFNLPFLVDSKKFDELSNRLSSPPDPLSSLSLALPASRPFSFPSSPARRTSGSGPLTIECAVFSNKDFFKKSISLELSLLKFNTIVSVDPDPVKFFDSDFSEERSFPTLFQEISLVKDVWFFLDASIQKPEEFEKTFRLFECLKDFDPNQSDSNSSSSSPSENNNNNSKSRPRIAIVCSLVQRNLFTQFYSMFPFVFVLIQPLRNNTLSSFFELALSSNPHVPEEEIDDQDQARQQERGQDQEVLEVAPSPSSSPSPPPLSSPPQDQREAMISRLPSLSVSPSSPLAALSALSSLSALSVLSCLSSLRLSPLQPQPQSQPQSQSQSQSIPKKVISPSSSSNPAEPIISRSGDSSSSSTPTPPLLTASPSASSSPASASTSSSVEPVLKPISKVPEKKESSLEKTPAETVAVPVSTSSSSSSSSTAATTALPSSPSPSPPSPVIPSLKLPVAPSPDPSPIPSSSPTPAPPAKKPRILMVEDNVVNQTVQARTLQSLGFECVVASNGKEGFERLINDSPFDLVLMDFQMPVMDGFEATTQIRLHEQQHNLLHTHVVGYTSASLQETKDRSTESGMCDVMFKPVRKPDLADTINKYIGQDQTGCACCRSRFGV